MKKYHRVLTIAGSDSGGGAGIQADLKTFAALGCYGLSVITAVTAQNTQTVTAIHPIPAAMVQAQLEAVLSDIGADAIKIGMLHNVATIQVVAEMLQAYPGMAVVLDPVMISTSGKPLLQPEAIEALKILLMPLATLITPNIPEAEMLLSTPVKSLAEMQMAAEKLAVYSREGVLLKGGHLLGQTSTDVLYQKSCPGFRCFEEQRIQTPNTHGTGCTLSAAIATGLAKGLSLEDAVDQAKTYLTGALIAGQHYPLGHGHGPVHHFFPFWE